MLQEALLGHLIGFCHLNLHFHSISQKQKPVMAEGMLAAMIIAVTSIGSPPLPLRPVLFV